MEEYLDILNANGDKVGETRTYKDAHLFGLPHRVVHIWLVNSKKQLLLQKRSIKKTAYPNYWDSSAAGHLSAGEMSLQAAKREVKEELGLDFVFSDFKLLVTVKLPAIKHSEVFIDNEFQDAYVVHSDVAISELKFQPDEVEEARWIDKEEFAKWVAGKGEKLVPRPEEHKKLLEYLV